MHTYVQMEIQEFEQRTSARRDLRAREMGEAAAGRADRPGWAQ